MKYRRNADDKLRRLEREYAGSPNASTLMAYNTERLRHGETLIVAPSSFIRSQKHLWEPTYWSFEVDKLQFTAIELRKNILDKTLPFRPETREGWQIADQSLRRCIPEILALGWVCLLSQCGNIKLKIKYNRDYEEYIVQWMENGRMDENKSYFTPDKDDAEQTMAHMLKTLPPLQYPTMYLMPGSILRPSGTPEQPALVINGNVIADQWLRYEDPRSLTDPQYRRGSYPVKAVLYEKRFPPNHAQYDRRFVTTLCAYRYEDPQSISFSYSHYDLTWETAKIDYLTRVLKPDGECDYQLFDRL